MEQARQLLKALFPELTDEIRSLLQADSRGDLITSLDTAEVVGKCGCKDKFCSSIYTASKPASAWEPSHETVPLEPKEGMINLDTVEGRIVYIEVIDRPDVRIVVNQRIK